MISEIGYREARELLLNQNIGRLGCCHHDMPYVVPVNYFFDGEAIYIHSMPGRKIQIMRANPYVCLQVDEIKDSFNWLSVIAFGQFEEVYDTAERDRIMAAMFQRFPYLTPVESKAREGLSDVIVFRIRIERITGVSEHWP
ncbi:MAG TPA: pyridoxamine 5'-phosphate oxidase family protein [Blastocatellia bacterium]|nr:pyridoxamine 5'-phosphate oxidase family protein [Blastocatellia bacterium]